MLGSTPGAEPTEEEGGGGGGGREGEEIHPYAGMLFS